jgi:hypothetical protein
MGMNLHLVDISGVRIDAWRVPYMICAPTTEV